MGSVHEWTHHDPDIVRNKATHWYVPTTILSTLASNALTSSISGATNKRFAIWIGKRVWPTPSILALTMNRSVSKESLAQKLERCFFIDLPSERMRLWTICTALRCPSVAVVIADISKLPFPAMRQVTLSAKKGRTLALLTRAPWQNTVPLSGQMRWTVRPLRSDSTNSRWELALTRCKGVQATRPLPIKWTVEFSHEAEDEEVRLHIPADSSYTDTSYTETSHTKTNCADTTATQQPTTVHAVA